MLHFFKKLFSKTLYPELEKAGGLTNVLNAGFFKVNSPFKVKEPEYNSKIPLQHARIEHLNKFSQVTLAKEEKLYLLSFVRDGVWLAHAKLDNLASVIEIIHYWLSEDILTSELAAKYSFIKPNEYAIAFDENREVEYKWNMLLHNESFTELHSFIELAIKDATVNKLFPFTSMYTLCLSRCTGYPYDMNDLPVISPKLNSSHSSEKLFRVVKPGTGIIGDGNAHEALKMVKDNLPANIQPARKGTAED